MVCTTGLIGNHGVQGFSGCFSSDFRISITSDHELTTPTCLVKLLLLYRTD